MEGGVPSAPPEVTCSQQPNIWLSGRGRGEEAKKLSQRNLPWINSRAGSAPSTMACSTFLGLQVRAFLKDNVTEATSLKTEMSNHISGRLSEQTFKPEPSFLRRKLMTNHQQNEHTVFANQGKGEQLAQ